MLRISNDIKNGRAAAEFKADLEHPGNAAAHDKGVSNFDKFLKIRRSVVTHSVQSRRER